MHEALYYIPGEAGAVQCTLCPHLCSIKPGHTGSCHVRSNVEGRLNADTYGRLSSMHPDPIEKKPLYHFYPGSTIFSVGSVGCNLHCRFCQNCEISQVKPGAAGQFPFTPPEELVEYASSLHGNIGIAYTYNEPAVFFEYMLDSARLAHRQGLQNVMVTNGFINPGPLAELLPVMDAFSIDLKGFSEEFYRPVTGGSLEPVLNTIRSVNDSGRHFELVHLLVPGLNDDEEVFARMVDWIASELGRRTVLHISRYFPRFHMTTDPTPMDALQKFTRLAQQKLDYVYSGNTGLPNYTRCPRCGEYLIFREGYLVSVEGLDEKGNCRKCSEKILNFCQNQSGM